MDKDTFKTLLSNTYKSLVNLTASKGEEYSRDADQLANFKRQAEELNTTPEKILMVYLNKHLDSIKSFVKTGKVHSEPIEGRIDDAILYLILLKGIVQDDRSRFYQPTNKTLFGQTHSMSRQCQESGSTHDQTEDIHLRFELK